MDFQTILPALLVPLTSPDKSVRQASAHCIYAFENVCKASTASTVYAFDTVYGEGKSEEVRYLDWSDTRKFVGLLCAERAKFVEDADGLRVYLAGALRQEKGVKKKLECVCNHRVCVQDAY